MDLSEAVELLEPAQVRGYRPANIADVAYDSRQVKPGVLFVCIPGFSLDGHDFAHEAVRRGASALVVQRFLDDVEVPQIQVDDSRRALLVLSRHVMDYPHRDLLTLGVTGTNGKTTVCFLTRHLLSAQGLSVGQVGTVSNVVGGRMVPVVRTTPESRDLNHLLRDMVLAGDEAVVMEVSSHALALDRIDPSDIDVAAFTNLSQDHLDFHESMENYFEAKARLFLASGPKDLEFTGVVNVDDAWGQRLQAESARSLLSFGLETPADLAARRVETGPGGSRFRLVWRGHPYPVQLPLAGAFNVSNALAAAGMALAAGMEAGRVAEALSDAPAVPGRFELVDEGQDFPMIVDYAHTPAGLENVLRAAGQMVPGQVIAVFGCGGDRDREKRPLMGEVAARLAGLAIITNDNPRTEDPGAIIDEIMKGHRQAKESGTGLGEATVVEDRAEAIRMAIQRASARDVVVVAGKGHETYQVFRDRTEDFDDRRVAARVLREKR